MPIKGISEIRRLPRLGKIRLGIKKKNANGKEFPTAVDYFVCPDEVQKIYGEKPRELDIVIPMEEIENVFPQYYKMYGHSTGLKCKGDGEKASCINESGEFDEIECLGQQCPNYQSKKCREVATLNFILPKVKLDGIYQLDTSSFHSIVKINSSLEYIFTMFGKISMLPLKLVMEDQTIHPDKKMKKTIKTLRIAFNASEVMKSVQKREGLLEQAGTKKIEAPKTEAPKVQLPSSDDSPTEDSQIEKTYILKKDCPNIGKEKGDYYNNEYKASTEELLKKEIVEEEKIETPKKEAPKVQLPSSDDSPENDIRSKVAERIGKEEADKIDNPPKKQGKTYKQVSPTDEEEISLCDVCELALSDKELKSCGKGIVVDGEVKYQFLCDGCKKELKIKQ